MSARFLTDTDRLNFLLGYFQIDDAIYDRETK